MLPLKCCLQLSHLKSLLPQNLNSEYVYYFLSPRRAVKHLPALNAPPSPAAAEVPAAATRPPNPRAVVTANSRHRAAVGPAARVGPAVSWGHRKRGRKERLNHRHLKTQRSARRPSLTGLSRCSGRPGHGICR